MELKHYSLSQLLATFSNEHEIKVRLEQGEASVGVELYKEAGVQVRDLSYRLGALLKPVEAEIMSKRLYKLRLGQISSSKERNVYQSAIKDTKLTVEVWRPCVAFATDTPCVALDLTPKDPVAKAVELGGGYVAPSEEVPPSTEPAFVEVKCDVGQPKEDCKSYSLADIISPYEPQGAFKLRFDFSRVKVHGVERCGFICSPSMDCIAQDLILLKTSSSDELCDVFNEIENMQFVSGAAYGEDVSSFIATWSTTTVRVSVMNDLGQSELKAEPAQAPKPTLKETFISWLRKILS